MEVSAAMGAGSVDGVEGWRPCARDGRAHAEIPPRAESRRSDRRVNMMAALCQLSRSAINPATTLAPFVRGLAGGAGAIRARSRAVFQRPANRSSWLIKAQRTMFGISVT